MSDVKSSFQIPMIMSHLGAVYMSWASPANQVDEVKEYFFLLPAEVFI